MALFQFPLFQPVTHFGHWLLPGQRREGAWHLHVLVLLPYDIRTGVDFTQFALGRYSSAPPYLRAVWRELRIKCKAYGFGRHELLPIKSNADAMAQYIVASIFQNIWDPEKMRIKVKGSLLLLQVGQKTAFVFLVLTTIPFCGVLTLPFSPEN